MSTVYFVTLLMLPLISGHAEGIDVRLLSWSEYQPQPLYVQRDVESFEPLALRSNRRSTAYELYEPGLLRVYTDGVDVDGNAIKVQVLETAIPKGIKEPLVILFSAMKEGKPFYRATVMEDEESVFPFGSYRVINLSGYPIAFEIDSDPQRLDNRGTALVQPKVQARENIAVRFYVLEDGEPLLVRQTFWRHQPGQRMMVFVIKGRDPQRPDYVLYTISEREEVYRRLHDENQEAIRNP